MANHLGTGGKLGRLEIRGRTSAKSFLGVVVSVEGSGEKVVRANHPPSSIETGLSSLMGLL